MKNLYESSDFLDKRASESFGISSEILMENAAAKIEKIVRKHLKKGSKILAICGSGNNAADAVCALRRLCGDYKCEIYLVFDKQNSMLTHQLAIAQNVGVKICSELKKAKCYIDGIFGSGLNKELSDEIADLINGINSKKALKIAVDIPSGIGLSLISKVAFKANYTVSMGALKLALFSDFAKDYVGKVAVANLGVSRGKFELPTTNFLLEKKDLNLPRRKLNNTNKGSFGHTFVVCGQMSGAAIIAGLASSAIGSGLVSLVSDKSLSLPPNLMQKSSLENAKVVAVGMGLGGTKFDLASLNGKKAVIDADLFYDKNLVEFLNDECVLTPHPKEFSSLLELSGFGKVSVSEIQQNRFFYAKKWSEKFSSVLVLKGANTIITFRGEIFVMPLGSSKLAKGGSGDALAGMIAGLLANGYSPLDAAISGTIAHAMAAKKAKVSSFAMDSLDLIKGIKCL
ncbi:MAG: NAD(P)H-hydrate dehydratase [Campylobacter sp.]|nr:NAD(P)H-hydrate dehydratase [Campylobacter sp.]